jgi:hypothetical protein
MVMRLSFLFLLLFFSPALSLDYMLADITEPVVSPFATYVPIPVTVDPSVEPWEIEPDLSNVANADDFDLTDEEQALLVANSFVVVPAGGKTEVYDLYNENRDFGIPSYVSSDAFLHAYHVLFDHLLKTAELASLFEALKELNATLTLGASATLSESDSPEEVDAATRLLAFHSLAALLLDSTLTPQPYVADLVESEYQLVMNHAGRDTSLIFGYEEDYTQYIVRGHYTSNDTLASFFRTMMWYGRMAFLLDDEELALSHTLSALFLVRDMALNPETETLWTTIYWPTVFFVGRSDDLIPDMYVGLAEQVYGAPLDQLTVADLADSLLLEEFIAQARVSFPQPEIGAGAPRGLRFMGQRFIPDSYVLDQVVYPHTSRWMPKGLDVMASLGSDRALWILENIYQEFGDQLYVDQLDAMREYMASQSDSTWAQNLYYNWLYSLMPLLFEKGEGWPIFMINPAWQDRELSTSLMSWGELRHDTILYAKQSETEISIPPAGALIQGYVEPNPYLWARLAALADYTADGLEGLDLISVIDLQRLDLLRSVCVELLEISLIELEGRQLTPDQDAFIADMGIDLRIITTVDSDVLWPSPPMPDDSVCTAVVADVHTDLNTLTCLEEGVGYPWEILVVVRRGETLWITRGVFLPYYEFVIPIDERMTDEEWQELLTSTTPPTPPIWTGSFRDTTVSVLNLTPTPFDYETESICSFSFALNPDPPDTGLSVVVTVQLDPLDGITIADPSLRVIRAPDDTSYVTLNEIGLYSYQGSFSTVGWDPCTALLWFYGESIGGRLLLDWSTEIQVGEESSGDPQPDPTVFRLRDVRPNPASEQMTISFSLPSAGFTRLSLHDLAGRERAVLRDGHLRGGHHVLSWSPSSDLVRNGAYVLKLTWEDQSQRRIIVLTR